MNRTWMPLHIADYLADTGHLSALEHGAYLLLIMHYWKDGRLPADERMLARLAKLTSEQWAESRDMLAALFVEGWRHKRIDEELAKADAIISKRKAAAEQMHENRRANAEQVQSTSSDTGGNTLNQVPTSSLRSEVKRVPRDELLAVLDEEHASAVLEHRQRLRKPLSVRAAKLLATSIAKFPDANAAADRMIEKGWASIEVGWTDRKPLHGPPRGKRMNAVEALQSLYSEHPDEPSRTSSFDDDAERLPSRRAGLPAPVVDLRRGPEGSFEPSDY